MTETRCDRCDAVKSFHQDGWTSLKANANNAVTVLADDLCPRCFRALKEFLLPLPKEAKPPPMARR